MGFNIAIDGPAGAGKSTVARIAAKRLQFIYVDTGAMYRAIGFYMNRLGVSLTEEAAVCREVEHANVSIVYSGEEQRVILNGEDVSGVIRGEQVGAMASVVSAYAGVREHLLGLQRKLAAEKDVLMDGRDIGTCILPDADVKIYLTADPAVRAMRRCLELREKGIACDEEEILRQIIERDEHDMHRAIAPLRRAEDAVLVDTSHLTAEEAVEEILKLVEERRGKKQAGRGQE